LVKESNTLIAFAEAARETFVKESKFAQKKVYGVGALKRQKTMKVPAELQRSNSLPSSPNRMGSVDEGAVVGSRRYSARVSIFALGSPGRKFVMNHLFDERFYVQQI